MDILLERGFTLSSSFVQLRVQNYRQRLVDFRSVIRYRVLISMGLGFGALVVLPFIMNDLVRIRFKAEMFNRCANEKCSQTAKTHFEQCFAGHRLRDIAQYGGGQDIVRCIAEASGKPPQFK